MNVLKKVLSWVYDAIKETRMQSWSLLGFFYGWVAYDGQTKIVLGWLTIINFAFWILTMWMDKGEE